MIFTLAVILFILLLWIGKGRGVKTFLSLCFNFMIFAVMILCMNFGMNPLVVTLLGCIGITAVTLFFLNDINMKTKTAFISVLITLLLLITFILILSNKSKIQGFTNEDADEISIFSLNIHLNMIDVIISVIIMGLIGSIIDIAISISSALHEIFLNNKDLSKNELFKSGMNIGRDIIGTMTNTLFFAFIAGFMGFFIWHFNTNMENVINSKALCSQLIRIFCSGIGTIIIIPISSFVSSTIYYLKAGR